MRKREDTLIGSNPRRARRHGIELHGRAVAAAGSTVSLADGADLDVRGVIWATGFRVDHAWIDVPVFDENGRAVHERGVTTSPGLYFLGQLWQHTRGSALLGWVKDDAAHIAGKVAAFRPGPLPTEIAGATR
jgi:putative flavoprotein involved in K+ transport